MNQSTILTGPGQLYDDCPICQAMKKAEKQGRSLTEEELKKAFTEAEKVGGVVGIPGSALTAEG